MIIAPDFFDHWKTQALIELTGRQESPLWLQRLWAHCQTRKAWVFRDLTDLALKSICRVPPEITADRWKQALLETKFIRETGPKVIVHQWDEHNASLIQRWNSGKQPKHKRRASGEQAESKRSTTDREDRLDREDKKGRNLSAQEIYLAYPRHVGRVSAIKAIERVLERVSADALLMKTMAFSKATDSWPVSDRRFIPHPATWFNAGRYDDDPAEWNRLEKSSSVGGAAVPFDPTMPNAHTGGLTIFNDEPPSDGMGGDDQDEPGAAPVAGGQR